METLADSVELYRPLSLGRFVLQSEAEEVMAWESTRLVLQTWLELLKVEPGEVLTEARFLQLQDMVKEKASVKGKNLFQPIRVAVIGKPQGTELKILVPLMKKETLIKNAEICLLRYA